MPIHQIQALPKIKGLRIANPTFKPVLSYGDGSVTGQGEKALNTDVIRNKFGVSGKGIKIGVLSDSYNNLNGATESINSGDLPQEGVEVLTDLDRGGLDEGRAMLEIIHDIAPDAELLFRTGVISDVDFALGMIELAQAGCAIILDDVAYLNQPFFQQGIIAQSVDSVQRMGVALFTSAGNTADQSYEAVYTGTNSPSLNDILGEYKGYHAFALDDIFMHVLIPPQTTLKLSFQWRDPFFSASGGDGAQSDLDIFLLDENKNIVAQSIENNLGNDPLEILFYENSRNDSLELDFVIAHKDGPTPREIKYIDFTGIETEYETSFSTIFGHANTPKIMTVGAVPFYLTPAFGVNPPLLSSSSALGGTPILFDFAGNETDLTYQKPEITAPEGVNTTFFGNDTFDDEDNYPNFFGTSAAVPHVAAVAALMLEASGGPRSLSPNELFKMITTTALDMEETGFDFRSGYGFLDAEKAVKNVISQTLIINEIETDTPGEDALEFIELYDGGYGNIPLNGLNLIFYDPETMLAYQSHHLGRHFTNDEGFFVIGSAELNQAYGNGTVDTVVSLTKDFFPNRPGILVLAKGDETAFPVGATLPESDKIIDMVLFTQQGFVMIKDFLTDLNTLPCANEGFYLDAENHSVQRFPDGNRNLNAFTTYLPTPGKSNIAPPAPAIQISPNTKLDFDWVNTGENSKAKVHRITGEWLSSDTLMLITPFGFEASFLENTGFRDTLCFSENLKPKSIGRLDTLIYIRFSPKSTINGIKDGKIELVQKTSVLNTLEVQGIEIGNQTSLSRINAVRNLLDENLLPNFAGNVKVKGVIHSINLSPPNYQFTLIEGANELDGIGIFIREEAASLLGIKVLLDTLEVGDEIIIEGILGSQSGLMQIIQPVEIQITRENIALQNPISLSILDENAESRMVKLPNVIISDSNEWLGSPEFSGESFVFQVVNKYGEYSIHIDGNTPLAKMTYGEVFGQSNFGLNLVGIGAQFDETNPRDAQYRLMMFAPDQISRSDLNLVVTSINDGVDPEVGLAFEVKVQVQDNKGNPVILSQDTEIMLYLNNGKGILEGNLRGKILAGTDCVQVSGLSYGMVEEGLTLGVKTLSGNVFMTGESDLFAVTPVIDLSSIQIKVIPNPIENNFRVEFTPSIGREVVLSIVDHVGKVYASRKLTIREGFINENIKLLQPGIYILQIKIDKTSISKQIIKR